MGTKYKHLKSYDKTGREKVYKGSNGNYYNIIGNRKIKIRKPRK